MLSTQRSSRLYNALLFETEAQPTEVIETKREACRRDPVLISQRNDYLAHRFYYKSKIQRKLYTDIITELQAELYLSAFQLGKLLNANADMILRLKKAQPSLTDLKKKYPHIIW